LAGKRIFFGFLAVLVVLVVNAVISYRAISKLIENERSVARSHELITEIVTTFSVIKDAETGQRGFVLTGEDDYLEPYNAALATIDKHFNRISELTKDNANQQQRLADLKLKAGEKIELLRYVIEIRRRDGLEEAMSRVRMGRGKAVMDEARAIVSDMMDEENRLLEYRAAESRESGRSALLTSTLASLFAILLVMAVYYLINRDFHVREQNAATLQIERDNLEKRVEERTAELAKTNIELERSNRELQDFAFVASHDLQEPLRKIQAFGDRLKTKHAASFNDEGRDYLERMQNAARRMYVLINDLLTFSRVTTKAQPFVPVDLSQVAKDVIDDLETRIQQTGGQVEIGELPELEADPLQMRQLLQNLIGNALKFHRPEAPPVVRLDSQMLTDDEAVSEEIVHNGDHKLYQLTVADNGIGFDEKYLDRIFTPFQRLHSRNEYEGTGMGLAVCRKIVERHGGSITAKSTPGSGTTFEVILPATHTEGDTDS
jgi:signal transduction histidine kinase